MSNNIYDILKKIESLEAPRQNLTEGKKAKPDYIDIDKDGNKKEPMKKAAKDKAKGGMAEAVARVEKQLSEKFHNHKKAVEESGLMYHAGVKKHGKKYMDLAKEAGQKGASQEELGRLKDKHSKAYKNKKMDEDSYNEDMLSPKQKSFAALAEPKDKITYADKIAGAKKGKKTEGNKFSGNLMKARAQGLKQADLDGDGDMEPVRGGKNLDEDQVNEFDIKLRQPYGPEFNKMFGADIAGSDQDKAIISKMKPDDYVEKNKFVKDYPTDKDYQEWNRRQDVIRGKEQQDMYNYVQRYNRDNNNLSLGQWAEKGYNKLKSAVTGQPEPKTSYQSYRWDPERRQETHKDERDFPVYPNKSGTMKEGRTSMREGWEEMQKYLEKKRGPESKGGAGKKAGTRYGGSAQKDDDEDTDGEGKPVEKKKGRPKGTGGGAKFSFKKPKD